LYRPISGLALDKGITLVDEIGRSAGGVEQHINVDPRPAGVTVSLSTRDVALAGRISAAAKELNIPAWIGRQ
jgi:4a-hydroxytetrahydrobiopterin dehydratase